MTTKTKRVKRTSTPSGNPQLRSSGAQMRTAVALLATTDMSMTRTALGKQLADIASTALANALFHMKDKGRITVEKTIEDGKSVRAITLTPAGRDWATQAGATASAPQPAKPRSAPTVGAGAVDVLRSRDLQVQVVEQPSFRCAVFSDGGFMVAKNGQQVELTRQEHAQMLRYLERMAEPLAA